METPVPKESLERRLGRVMTSVAVIEVIGLALGLIFRGWVQLVMLFFFLGVALRAVLSLWTLGFTRPDQMLREFKLRLPIFIAGAIGVIGMLTFSRSIH